MGWGGGRKVTTNIEWELLLCYYDYYYYYYRPSFAMKRVREGAHLSPFRQLLSICMPSCGAPRLRWYATSSRPMTKEQTVNLARQYILNNNMIYKCFKLDNNVQIKYKIIKYINKHFNLRAKRSLSWQALSHHTHAETAEGRHQTEVTRIPLSSSKTCKLHQIFTYDHQIIYICLYVLVIEAGNNENSIYAFN